MLANQSYADAAVGALRQAGGSGSCPEVAVVELATGRELLVLALLLAALMTVMWVLARTRRSPR